MDQGGDGFYSGGYGYEGNQSYDVGAEKDFVQDQQGFGQFDYNAQMYGGSGSYMTPAQPGSAYMGSIMTPGADLPPADYSAGHGDSYEDEPPLMEELGINFDHITQKTLAVLNPLKEAEHVIMQDTDLAGPLVFCLAFGATLMLTGKIHFGYIYGIGVVGCLAMYCLLNLMSMTGVAAGIIVSVLGYCLLPMVFLSGLAILTSLKGVFGMVVTGLAVLWCSLSASKLFVSALAMDHQQPLVAYPCALVYGVFALLTVF